MEELVKWILEQPIKIVDVTDKGINWFGWSSLVWAVTATIFTVLNNTKHSKVYGKVLSKTVSGTGTFSNEQITHNGQKYILKLSLSCTSKDLNFKDIKVKLKYGKEEVEAIVYWANSETLNFGDGPKKLKLPPAEFLTFNTVLENNKVYLSYLSFIVPEKEGDKYYDEITLEFIKPNNKITKVKLTEVPKEQFLFEEHLFPEIDQ